MSLTIKTSGVYKYVDTEQEGEGNLVLLHGLFGELSNFEALVEFFRKKYRVIIPLLPLVDIPIREIGLGYIVRYTEDFVNELNLNRIHLLGNSLGGHIAQLYALKNPDRMESLILTGSSGLFENSFGGSFLRRNDYDYIKNKVELTFYDNSIVSKEMVDKVFEQVNNRNKAIRLVGLAKSAIKHNLENKISQIKTPTLLIWGKNDTITPPFVAEKFHSLIKNSVLNFIDKCGHAPMMETPRAFIQYLDQFLMQIKKPVSN